MRVRWLNDSELADLRRAAENSGSDLLRGVVFVDGAEAGGNFHSLSMYDDFIRDVVGEISDTDLFYNHYYWGLVCCTLWPSAGMEQQAFQVLEHADCDFEGEFLMKIEECARRLERPEGLTSTDPGGANDVQTMPRAKTPPSD